MQSPDRAENIYGQTGGQMLIPPLGTVNWVCKEEGKHEAACPGTAHATHKVAHCTG